MYSVIIVAAGSGSRTGLAYNKIFYEIKNQPLIKYTLDKFINDDDFSEVIIILSRQDIQSVKSLFNNSKIKYTLGGKTRQESVLNGLNEVSNDVVFIHDCARPNIYVEDLNKLKNEMVNREACVLYTSVKDSVLKMENGKVLEYIDRSSVALVQTPQVFKTNLIKEAHLLSKKNNNSYTDDASLFINELKRDVYLVEGNELNFKVTTKRDLLLLEEIL